MKYLWNLTVILSAVVLFGTQLASGSAGLVAEETSNLDPYTECRKAGHSYRQCTQYPDDGIHGPEAYVACIEVGHKPRKCHQSPDDGRNGVEGYVACIEAGHKPRYCHQSNEDGRNGSPAGYVACIEADFSPRNCHAYNDVGSTSDTYADCIKNPRIKPATRPRYCHHASAKNR